MKKILLLLLLLPYYMMSQSNENYTKTTNYTTPYFGSINNYSSTFSNFFYCSGGTYSGGSSGSINISNNILTVNFSGSWSSTCRLQTGIVASINSSPILPDTELGKITKTGGVETGYYAKIESGNLVFYSPFFIKGVSTNLVVDYLTNVSYTTSLGNNDIFQCTGTGAGGASGSLKIQDNKIIFNISGTWSELCNLKTGVIKQLVLPAGEVIDYVELGAIKDNEGNVTNYKVAIQSNYLFIYNESAVPSLTTSVNTQFSYNFGQGGEKIETVSYYDGLGRIKQKISAKAGGQQQDIVIPYVYDDLGRESKQYLPYSNPLQTVSSLNYINNTQLISSINSRYLQKFPGELSSSSPNPYSESIFEASPLNRVIEQAAPGLAWKNGTSNDRTIKKVYDVNSSSDLVKKFTVTTTWNSTNQVFDNTLSFNENSYYQTGTLDKIVIKDENWISGTNNTTEEFRDRNGNVILKRQYNSSDKHDTYYVYDKYNRLVYVIPPLADATLFTQTTVQEPYVYSQFISFQDLLTSSSGGSVSGGGGLTISIENSVLKLYFSGSFSSSYINTSVAHSINAASPIPNMTIGTLSAGFPRYSMYIDDNKLKFVDNYPTASPFTNFYDQSFTVSLDSQVFGYTQTQGYVLNSTVLNSLCYQYKYDYRNREVEKKLPGKGSEYIVYDKFDRPVMSQDQMLKGQNLWLFTKYDQFGRVVYSGKHNNSGSRKTLQENLNNLVNTNLYETGYDVPFTNSGADVYYTNKAFPNTSIEVLQINYYDDYRFYNGVLPDMVYDEKPTSRTTSLMTGTYTRVIDTDKWILNRFLYDENGKVIYSYTNDNYLNYNNIISSDYDFANNLIETETQHEKKNLTTGTWTVTRFKDYYSYDHYNRLLSQVQEHLASGNKELLFFNKYDEFGQLIQKKAGGTYNASATYDQTASLQTVDYKYNIRNWLVKINDPNSLGSDLFGQQITYNAPTSGGVPLYNGNISQTIWRTVNDSGTNTIRKYSYTYDGLSRLSDAHYSKQVGSTITESQYDEELTYDKNGNIITLNRWGTNDSNPFAIDKLLYVYNGNQILRLKDVSGSGEGFADNVNYSAEYVYDQNGNIIKDYNKGVESYTYNHMNLPKQVKVSSTKYIDYIYDAKGNRISKRVTDGSTTTLTEYYGGFTYLNGVMQFYSSPEGYVMNDGGSFEYVYQYRDHLGNVRLSYSDVNNNGVISSDEVLSENNYYPFGLKHMGYNGNVSSNVNSVADKNKYNGKEFEEELGQDTYAYGWRDYDPVIGRFLKIDRFAEKYYDLSNYSYAGNNPILFNDIQGDSIGIGRKEFNQFRKIVSDRRDRILARREGQISKWEAKGKTDKVAKKTSEWAAEDAKEGSVMNVLETTLSELDALESSDQLYDIDINAKTIDGDEGGYTIYDVSRNSVRIAVVRGRFSFGKLAHELKHAYQFETGKLSYSSNGFSGLLYDYSDEVEAVGRGEFFGDYKRSATEMYTDYGHLPSGPISSGTIIDENMTYEALMIRQNKNAKLRGSGQAHYYRIPK